MWTCTRCSMENPDTLKACEKCGARRNSTAHPTGTARKPAQSNEPDPAALLLQKYETLFRRTRPPADYSVLDLLSNVLNVMGVLSLLGGIVTGVMLGNAGYRFDFWVFLTPAIAGAFGLVAALVVAQLIYLFISMDSHAYETNMLAYITAHIHAEQVINAEQDKKSPKPLSSVPASRA